MVHRRYINNLLDCCKNCFVSESFGIVLREIFFQTRHRAVVIIIHCAYVIHIIGEDVFRFLIDIYHAIAQFSPNCIKFRLFSVREKTVNLCADDIHVGQRLTAIIYRRENRQSRILCLR